MPRTDNPTVPTPADTTCLLFLAPTDFIHDRLAAALIQAGATVSRSTMGLKMGCSTGDWSQMLSVATQSLSVPALRAIRVTQVPRLEGATAMQTTIFATCRLDELLARLSADWLRGLVERNTLSHHLQPLVQQPPGRLHGYECLIRGIDPAGKPVAPREMFRAADDLGNAAAFDEKCRLLAIQRAAAADLASLPLFINFDANTIYDPPGCLRPTMEAVKAAQVDPQRIVFEAVRSERVADRRHLADVVRHLKGQGFKVSLDDVGGEPSALLSMLDLRPDYVKLDGDLVPHAAHSPAKAKVVRGVAEAARQRGIITIAKGVETDPQLKFVFSAGIRITQGWVHAKPEAAPLSIDGSKEMITRCRAAYQGVSKSAPTDGAWDLRELYEKLATSARPAADASES